jgi:hypothetical protein
MVVTAVPIVGVSGDSIFVVYIDGVMSPQLDDSVVVQDGYHFVEVNDFAEAFGFVMLEYSLYLDDMTIVPKIFILATSEHGDVYEGSAILPEGVSWRRRMSFSVVQYNDGSWRTGVASVGFDAVLVGDGLWETAYSYRWSDNDTTTSIMIGDDFYIPLETACWLLDYTFEVGGSTIRINSEDSSLGIRPNVVPPVLCDCGDCEDCFSRRGVFRSQNITDEQLRQMVESGEIPADITHLWLSDNKITDISPLSALTNLEMVWLSKNQITDITALSGLENLRHVDLDNNQVADLSPLSVLTNLDSLWLNSNQIADLAPLAVLKKLEYLRLFENQINDIAPLSSLTNLLWTRLDSNQIDDLTPLHGLTKLGNVFLSQNPITLEQINSLQSALPNCNINHDLGGDVSCDCRNCSDCGHIGGRFGFGRVRGGDNARPQVNDALQILRFLVGLSSPLDAGNADSADALAAANITRAGQAVTRPQVQDALQILRFLVGLPTLGDWGAVYR